MIRRRAAAVFLLVLLMMAGNEFSYAQKTNSVKMKKKILFVVTSHDTKGNTGEKTGYYLSEVSHPWKVLKDAGYEIDFVSPKGGNPPVDGFDLSDPENAAFWEDKSYHKKITNTLKPTEVKAADYAAIYYAGGHGAMWDLPGNEEIAKLAMTYCRYHAVMLINVSCERPVW